MDFHNLKQNLSQIGYKTQPNKIIKTKIVKPFSINTMENLNMF